MASGFNGVEFSEEKFDGIDLTRSVAPLKRSESADFLMRIGLVKSVFTANVLLSALSFAFFLAALGIYFYTLYNLNKIEVNVTTYKNVDQMSKTR